MQGAPAARRIRQGRFGMFHGSGPAFRRRR
jgi:hypothetical protein